MSVFVPLAAAAAVGAAAKWAYDKWKNKLPPGLAPLPGAMPAQMAKSLTTGVGYAAVIDVDPASAAAPDFPQTLTIGLGQVGFQVLQAPTSRLPDKSQWATVGTWNGPNNTMPSAMPGYVKGINFYLVPSN